MIEKYEKKVLQLNVPLRGLPKGAKVKIEVDKKGTPTERYWRDRLKDAKKDKCVKFIREGSPTGATTQNNSGGDKDVNKEA